VATTRRLLAPLAALVLVASLGAAPVAARSLVASGGASELCAAPDASVALKAGRGLKVREKDTGQVHADMPAHAKGKAPADFTATIPVYVHVITAGADGNLTSSQVSSQIAVLNKTFGGREGGSVTGFSFTLAGVTRTEDATWFASTSAGAEKEMKQALKQGGDDALNVYTTSGGGFLGWAYLPTITTSSQSYLDGIVIDWRTVPGGSSEYVGRYDLGETLTHETGHWLNLEHTFFGACNKSGDFVADTPAEKTATSGCPAGKDTCRAPGDDPIHNYMDYSYDTCYTQFTDGQTQRMRDAWLFYRAS
jgi:Pregnancy-associated plasma protein-A